MDIINKEFGETKNEFADKNSWTLVFLVTTFTVVFAFGIILFFPDKNNLMLSLRTAIATMLIGLGLIYTFKVNDIGFEVDYRALFFVSLLFICYGFVFGNLAVWGFSSLFLLVSLINVQNWKNEQKWSDLSEEVKKVKLVIIVTIILLFLVSIALLYINNKIEVYQAKVKENFIALSAKSSFPINKIYANDYYGVRLIYSGEYIENKTPQNQYITNNILIKIDLPSEYFVDTNLNEAAFIVGASNDEKAVSTCLNAAPSEKEELNTRLINGNEYKVFRALDAAAGNRYETTSYRLVRNNICYEAIKYLCWGEISNYPLGTIKEFNREVIEFYLDEMLSEFYMDK